MQERMAKNVIEISRTTKETDISLKLLVYGNGNAQIQSGIGFFDHMLQSLTKHSLIDLELACKGDTFIDGHHSVEDCGIVLGQGLAQGIYPAAGIERFGNASIVMDEACVECDIDVSNRAFLVFETNAYKLPFKGRVGELDVELVEEFFRALCFNAHLSAHIVLKRGKNLHHIIEAMFKAFGVSLRRALTLNPRILTPSTKGVL
ncbi:MULTISPECIES: imidazoleglycerol-phosphate dehydratase HisB [Helicobacter]|jgi:imidazoleglycerol-phosphate dehydratase|uniref:Imidazoleglycerol-phosphate dehydratase n=1 Tax=Helicobacter hepaticus (strain ATCC 51449 / 3B1) TaxID=235279 RepID=HIS7_HELHP|nr:MULTISPECIES: imidazoleglycerol-phosphate dehydratase HisB [Helicobacter]Q7VGJ6.1 RecName: Full=Imidazoleglycerol-phosphate dehydratase; Short=IGPD [Helicobacter hepaticus ATCC 51449]AAP77922.1 imidazoleglycerol-phosphate dehydratase [Helicobacter hepaticus ATCC 51449]